MLFMKRRGRLVCTRCIDTEASEPRLGEAKDGVTGLPKEKKKKHCNKTLYTILAAVNDTRIYNNEFHVPEPCAADLFFF